MRFLIDRFSPAELLHLVTVTNRYQLLTTEQKRFIIAFRVACPYSDGIYQAETDRKETFNRVFGQFLTELRDGQICDKEWCPTCARFQALRGDFHGEQESEEFGLFMDWFTNIGKEPDPNTAPMGQTDISHLRERPGTGESVMDAGEGTMELFPDFSVSFTERPLFVLDDTHPLISRLNHLVSHDPSAMNERTLRAYAESLRSLSAQVLSGFSRPTEGLSSELSSEVTERLTSIV